MDLTEEKIAEALGVELPRKDDQGGNGQGVADPAEGQNQNQEPEQAVDAATGTPAPAGDAGAEPEGGGDDQDGQQDGAGDQPGQPMPEEERRANAARRRQAEQQAAVDAAVNAERARHQAEMEDFFRRAGLKNTISGQPITTMGEFNAWKKDFDAARLQKELDAGKLTPDGLNTAIENNPVVQKIQEMARRQAETDARAQREQMQAQVERELEEIRKVDPSVKTVQDILDKPTGKAFYEYVQRGNNFADAFYLANRQELAAAQAATAQRTAEAARQQAAANARSKAHLNAAPGVRGEGAVSVPKAEMRYYRELLGDEATEAEIQAAYADYMKDKK